LPDAYPPSGGGDAPRVPPVLIAFLLLLSIALALIFIIAAQNVHTL
jgi:hypothetical protein